MLVRPLNSKEILQNCSECISLIPDAPQILIGQDRPFTFDYVFASDTPQGDVFEDCALPLLEKLMEGYNATILAYGGKTYSMGTAIDGANIPPDHQGIVPRAIYRLFEDLEKKKIKHPSYEYEVAVSFLELYNEDLIDLLNLQREHNKKGKSDLTIREDANGQIYWAGVKEVTVGHLQKGSLSRTVASTEMNLVSSRSHAIFSVILKQTKVEEEDKENKENQDPSSSSTADTSAAAKRKSKSKASTAKIVSKFHFVDLAGSERLKRTNAVGDRAKEGISINGGLLALGNVISALGDESRKVTHIPYRDSKLTRLLQDSLGGNSQTLMLACISPADSNFMETLNTLKYANRARNIKNKVSVNENFGGNSIEINQLRGQISRLKMEVQTLRSCGANEENTRAYEEEIKKLKGDLGMTKMKLQTVEQELIMANTEKKTLLLEIGYNDRDLSEADREHRMKTHHIIQEFETQISDYKNQVCDLQAIIQQQQSASPRKSSLAGSTPGREKGHIKFIDQPNNYSDDELKSNDSDNNNNTSSKKKKSKKKRSKKEGEFIKPQDLDEAKKLFAHYTQENENGENNNDDEIEIDQQLMDENGIIKFPRRLRRRSARDTIEKAKEQIKQGLILLKNGGSMHDDPVLSQLIKAPSTTKSESYLEQMLIANHLRDEKRRSSSVSFISFSDQQISPSSTKSSSSQNSTGQSSQQNAITLSRMLHRIQADIAVKEQLVAQLERAEQEFTFMRAQYEQQLAQMQENLINMQRERNSAVKRTQNSSTGVSTRDKSSILAELKARYEHKMKRLIQEIGDLRRKYNETTQKSNVEKNQNETMLRSMRSQVEHLKNEKLRLIKRMKSETEKIREMTERNEREVQSLRRKEKAAQEQRKRLEKSNEMQKLMLEKRQKEVLLTTGKLKSVMTLLKRTSTPKSIAKAFRNTKRGKITSGSAGNNGNEEEVKVSSDTARRTSDDLVLIEEEVFASGKEKKKQLDEAIYKYITGRQSLALMDELIQKRDALVAEKHVLLCEREKTITAENSDNSSDNGNNQDLDDRIEVINSEVTYMNARIRALQSEAARTAAAGTEKQRRRSSVEKVNNDDKSPSTPPRKNSGKPEKKLSFTLPEDVTPEASYDIAVEILRNLDPIEAQTVLESFFEDIIKLRSGAWSNQMTLAQQETTMLELRKTLLAMRRAAVLATVEYERRNKDLEEKLKRGGRSPSPVTEENKELKIKTIEDDAVDTISLFDRIYETALAQVETAVSVSGSGTPNTPNTPNASHSRRGSSYFFDHDDSTVIASPTEEAPKIMSRKNSRSQLPPSWLKNSETGRKSSIDSTGTKDSSNGNIIETRQTTATPSLQRENSTISRQNSSTSMGFYTENNNNSTTTGAANDNNEENTQHRDSGYFGGVVMDVKRRSQSSMAMVRRGSKDVSHLRQNSFGRNSPESEEVAGIMAGNGERRGSIVQHHTHTRSETPPCDNVYDRLSRSHTHSSSAKNTPTKKALKDFNNSERRGSFSEQRRDSFSEQRRGSFSKSHVKQNSGGVDSALAALEANQISAQSDLTLHMSKSSDFAMIKTFWEKMKYLQSTPKPAENINPLKNRKSGEEYTTAYIHAKFSNISYKP
nr:1789_t:CDS:10 [Entrophospora candida]